MRKNIKILAKPITFLYNMFVTEIFSSPVSRKYKKSNWYHNADCISVG